MKNMIILVSLFFFVHFLFAQNNHIQIGENIVYHQDLKFASAVGRLYFKQKSNTFSYGINMGCSF